MNHEAAQYRSKVSGLEGQIGVKVNLKTHYNRAQYEDDSKNGYFQGNAYLLFVSTDKIRSHCSSSIASERPQVAGNRDHI